MAGIKQEIISIKEANELLLSKFIESSDLKHYQKQQKPRKQRLGAKGVSRYSLNKKTYTEAIKSNYEQNQKTTQQSR